VEELELGVVEDGADLLVGGVASAQLPDLLLPLLQPLLVNPAISAPTADEWASDDNMI
jgi:hypothetical protein